MSQGLRERVSGAGRLAGQAVLVALAMVFPVEAGSIPGVGDRAPDFSLRIAGKDETVRLSDLTRQGPVVLVVLRGYPGYQCPVCTAQVAELVNRQTALRERAVRVVLVYPGPADRLEQHAAEFVSGKNLPESFVLLLDPDFSFTKSYGLRWDARGETAYPSTFVLDREGKVQFAKVSRTHGGRARADEVLRALAELPKPASR